MLDSRRTGKIDVSDVVQFLYCPRKVYFMKVAGFRIVKPKMEEGKRVQEEVLRKLEKIAEKMGGKLSTNVALESDRYGISGRIDALVLTQDSAFPIDVKFSKFSSISYAWKMQLTAYSVLAEENFGCRVESAFIYLVSERELLKEVRIFPEDKRALLRLLEEIRELLESESYPKASKSKKCNYCEVAKFCV
ncbi:MAG: CRISPR-associated protein Cas4 [Archaeoglobaceae archaeon]